MQRVLGFNSRWESRISSPRIIIIIIGYVLFVRSSESVPRMPNPQGQAQALGSVDQADDRRSCQCSKVDLRCKSRPEGGQKFDTGYRMQKGIRWQE